VTGERSPLVWDCSSRRLHPDLLVALRRAARAYYRQEQRPIRITSGWRSLRQQAELMSRMSHEQLLRLYAQQGIPDYLRAILESQKQNAPLSPAVVHDILCRRQEGYVSAHLCGAAVDAATEAAEVATLRRVLEAEGFAVLDEREDGIPCLHARLRSLDLAIVRE
jgi:hypothetical protein